LNSTILIENERKASECLEYPKKEDGYNRREGP